jgi:heat shock protein HslJ
MIRLYISVSLIAWFVPVHFALLAGDQRPTNLEIYPEDADLRLNDIWAMESLFSKSFQEETNPGKRPILEFHLDQMVVMGNTGCNSFHGKMETSNDELRIKPGVMTRMACPGDLEARFLKALRDTHTFKINKLQLHLIDKHGLTLMVLKKVD